ncbi:MAG: universal stress protein [Chloroflexi bacterium]|nr:universal stress protein [Chloroflexota bacterium]
MKRILVAVDLSKNTDTVIEQAILLAKPLNAKVWIIHVTPDKLQTYATAQLYTFSGVFTGAAVSDVELARNLCADEYKREHHALLHLSEQVRRAGIEAQANLMKGDPVELILKHAEDMDACMIVMGSHGHSLLRKVLVGSVAEGVLRDSLCNVLIVPAPLD